MNRKKGFTLIELLTVIVVLAVIALITVPVVNGITRRVEKSAFRQSAVGILNTIKLDRSNSGYISKEENDKYEIKDKKIYFEEEIIKTKHTGEITGVGDVYVNKDGSMAIAYTNNKWCAYKSYVDTTVKIISGNCNDVGILCDMTAPESVDFSYTVNLNKIKIVVTAKDSESGISKYEYSKDGGITWQTAENPQNNIYEYKDLLFNTKYQIKVRVYNGLTEKENCRENIETSESKIKEVKTEILKAPIIEVTPKGLAKEKEVTISYDGMKLEGFKIMYSLNEGEFREYTGLIKITENNTTIIARITDGTNVADKTEKVINIDNTKPIISVKDINEGYSKKDEITIEVDDIEENGSAVSGVTHYCIVKENKSENCTWESITGKTGKYEISENGTYYAYSKDLVGNISEGYMFVIDKIDTEKPSATLEITNTTTNSIEVKATCSDNIGIKSYEYSSDNGLHYKTGINNTYTFSNLKTGTYNLKLRCTDGVGNSTEASTVGTTGKIKIPSFTVTDSGVWTQSKIVTITYPEGFYTKKYRVINGTATKEDGTTITNGVWYEVSGRTDKIVLKSNGNIEAKVSDGINEISSSKSVNMIDTTGPSAPTVMKAVKSDWTIVNLSQWQNVNIYFPLVTPSGKASLVTGSVDNESGILKYQISADRVTWYDLGAYTPTGVYVTSSTTTRYYRAINNAGVAGKVASINVYIDKVVPTAVITVKDSSGNVVTNGKIVDQTDTYTVTIGCNVGASGVKAYSWNAYAGTSVIKTGTTNTFTIKASDIVFTCPSECSDAASSAGKNCAAACENAAKYGASCGRDCNQEAQEANTKCCKEKCEASNLYDCTSYGGTKADSIPISITAKCTNNINITSADASFIMTLRSITCATESDVTCTNGSLSGNVYKVCRDSYGNEISRTVIQRVEGSCGGGGITCDSCCSKCISGCPSGSSYDACKSSCMSVRCP